MFEDDDFELSWHEKNYYDDNPNYSPESWGLRIVGQIELSEPNYSFNTLIIWKRVDGKVFYGQDSGCSCPSPFENFHHFSDMSEVTKESLNSLRDILRNSEYAMRNGAQDLMYKVRDTLK